MSAAELVPFIPTTPDPLIRPLADGKPYPLECLPAILRDGVAGIVAKVQCPVALAANSVLAAAALVSQPHVDVPKLSGSSGPCSLFVLTIAQSGERKSSADDLAMKPIKDWERARVKDAQEADANYQRTLTAYEEAKKVAINKAKSDKGGNGERGAIEKALKNVGDAPRPPIRPNLICTEPTVEGLWLLLSEGLGSAGVFSAEGGAFVGGHAMNADNRLKSAALFSEMWDGEALRRVRVSGISSPLYGRRVSVHLMGQPDAMAQFMNDPTLRDQGLLARFLWSAPASTMGTRFQCVVSKDAEAQLSKFHCALSGCLQRPIPRAEDDERACAPVALDLTAEALGIITAFADDVERELAPSGAFHSITGVAAKLAEQALRIAGVFTFITNPDATQIDKATMHNACALALWHGHEALRLFNTGSASPEIVNAEALRVWMLKQPELDILQSKMLIYGPSRLRDTKSLNAALKVLSDHGWASKSVERPATWRIWRGAS